MGDLQLNFKEGISGDSKDIIDFLKNTNIELSDYFKASPSESASKAFKGWYLVVIVSLFIVTLFLCYFFDKTTIVFTAASLLSIIILVIVVFCVHLKFDKWPLTIIAIIGGIALLCASFHLKTIDEIITSSTEIIEEQF